jgi:putative peptidoglycan lipid II flippase
MISRVLGLVREMTRAALMGTSALSDAFTVAFLIPNLFRRLFAEGSISVAFIPTFKGMLVDDNRKRTLEFLSCFWTFLSFIVACFVALGMLAAPWLVRIFSPLAFNETVLLTRFMFPYLFFISLAAFFQGILNSTGSFAPSGAMPIVFNIVTIACAWLLKDLFGNPARAMACGIFLGGFLEATLQIPFVLKRGFRFHFTGLRRAFSDSGTRIVVKLVVPTIIGMAAYQLNDIVSTALAGRAGEGVVSSLQYSLRLQELVLGVFAVTIGTVILPGLSAFAKQGRWDEYRTRLTDSVNSIALITLPVSFFLFVQGEAVIRLLFQARSFNDTSVFLTLGAFRFHIAGLYFIALNRVLAPAFYARSDTIKPTVAGVASFAVNMALAALLVGPMKGPGIALALSIAGFANTALLLVFLTREKTGTVGSGFTRHALLYALKIAAFSAIAVVPVVLVKAPLAALFASRNRLVSQGAPLLVSGLLFAAIGIGLLFLTRDRYCVGLVRKLRGHTFQ